ncbi:MAG: HPF/RaiA family ribosome-associated protein [Kofleriaceae bacterium]
MKLTIRARHLDLSPEALDLIETRVAGAFDRIGTWIRAIDVTLTDVNGPKGGLDKHCRLRIKTDSSRSIVVEHVGVDTLQTAVDAAVRAQRTLLRDVSRRRTLRPAFAI